MVMVIEAKFTDSISERISGMDQETVRNGYLSLNERKSTQS